MDSTPPSSKRMKTCGVKRGGRLESWFAGEDENIENFLHETSRKAINNPKLISFSGLKEQKLFELKNVLKEKMLRRLLEMSRNIYPDLVRVFYTILQIVGDNLCTHVKGIDMEITPKVWSPVVALKYVGLIVNKGNIRVVEEFNKMQFYRRCLENPQSKVRNFSMRGLKLNERIVAFIVSWILTSRGSNYSILSEEDLVLIYYIMNKIKINWIHIIKDHM